MKQHKLHASHKDKISKEMYLKSIFLYKEEKQDDPKPKDVAADLGLAKGSVSEMLKKMAEEGLLNYETYGKITLTDKGLEHAKNVVRKYLTIRDFLVDFLKIDAQKAHEEACHLEHGLSDESAAKLNIFMKVLDKKD